MSDFEVKRKNKRILFYNKWLVWYSTRLLISRRYCFDIFKIHWDFAILNPLTHIWYLLYFILGISIRGWKQGTILTHFPHKMKSKIIFVPMWISHFPISFIIFHCFFLTIWEKRRWWKDSRTKTTDTDNSIAVPK